MKKNVGKIDKTIRILLGTILLGAGYFYGSWILGILGVVSIATGLLNFCGLYSIIGLNTCKIQDNSK